MAKQIWRYLLFLMCSHHPPERLHRTLRVGFGKSHVYLCSRCTGTVFGIAAVLAASTLGQKLPAEAYLPLIALLPLLTAVDWFTQSAKLRESRNSIRVVSGGSVGVSEALGLLSILNGFFFFITLISACILSMYAFVMYVIAARTRCLDVYLKEINQMQTIPPSDTQTSQQP